MKADLPMPRGTRREALPATLSRRNVLARAIWNVAWLCFYRPSPRPFHAWRRMMLRVFGARIGRKVKVYPTARIWAPWNLEMLDGSCLGDYVDCYSVDRVHLGRKATVSQYSYLCSAGRDYLDLAMPLITAPIVIGDLAWVTADVFIGPGVTIGDGAVVLARSSVFSDVPAGMIAGGNPAKPLRRREWRDPGAVEALVRTFRT